MVRVRNPEGWFRCHHCKTAFKGVKALVAHKLERHFQSPTCNQHSQENSTVLEENYKRVIKRENPSSHLDDRQTSGGVSASEDQEEEQIYDHLADPCHDQHDKADIPTHSLKQELEQGSSQTSAIQIPSFKPKGSRRQNKEIKLFLEGATLNYVSTVRWKERAVPREKSLFDSQPDFKEELIQSSEQSSPQNYKTPPPSHLQCLSRKLIKCELGEVQEDDYNSSSSQPSSQSSIPLKSDKGQVDFEGKNQNRLFPPPHLHLPSNSSHQIRSRSEPEQILMPKRISKANTMEKPAIHLCGLCGRKFKVSWARKRHEKQMHAGPNKPISPASSPVSSGAHLSIPAESQKQRPLCSTLLFPEKSQELANKVIHDPELPTRKTASPTNHAIRDSNNISTLPSINPHDSSCPLPQRTLERVSTNSIKLKIEPRISQVPVGRVAKKPSSLFLCESCNKSFKYESPLRAHQVYTLCRVYYLQKLLSWNEHIVSSTKANQQNHN